MRRYLYLIISVCVSIPVFANDNKIVSFQGQLIGNAQYAPLDGHYTLAGARYLLQLNINVPNNGSEHLFDFEFTADLSTYYTYRNLDSLSNESFNAIGELRYEYQNNGSTFAAQLKAYRFWTRYRYKSFELRLGLQQIDFGSSMLMRPLQWFTSIDPRDPLKITNGVFGVLGKYYFSNNANIWLWCLTMNTDPRGMELLGTDQFLPEFGTRIQYPIPRGEIAFTYNHRWVDVNNIMPGLGSIGQDQFALDGKWDIEVGLWFEATYSFLYQPVSILTNQFALDIGIDYTFGVGNGLNIALEHLIMTIDETPFAFKNIQNTTALQIAYPIAMFDNISAMVYYNYENTSVSAFVSYMHAFDKISLYTNLYYNPIIENNITANAGYNTMQMGSGVGLQVMIVFNH